MSLRNKIATELPFLRRYARALTGSQESGDRSVKATLEAILADVKLKDAVAGGRVALYRIFTTVWSKEQSSSQNADLSKQEAQVQDRLQTITPLNRQALLLSTLEEFSIHQVAQILDIEKELTRDLINSAIEEIDREAKTTVLIIEDEPLISMQLEDLVKSLGHNVTGVAATRSQALETVLKQKPGLVLADIQLADGSSGLDAVDDILAFGDLPVIFITAFPERLLTGNRPEPTYLITKPFREQTVRTTISQALFFGSNI